MSIIKKKETGEFLLDSNYEINAVHLTETEEGRSITLGLLLPKAA